MAITRRHFWGGRSPNEQVWIGLQWSPPDFTSRDTRRVGIAPQVWCPRWQKICAQVWCPGEWGYPYHVAYPVMYLMRLFVRLLISTELFDLNSFSITMKRVILMTRLIQVCFTQKYFTEYCYEIRETIWQLPSLVKHKQLDMKRKQ